MKSEGKVKLDPVNQQPETIIHKACGTPSTIGWYEDKVIDYLCPKCNVTFLNNEEQTVIS